MNKEIKVQFACENEFLEIKEKVALFFGKQEKEFEMLVPILYGPNKNTYQNHIVSKVNNEIVGILAFYEKELHNCFGSFKIMIIGSICVEANHRKQGIMTKMFEFLFNHFDNKVDCYILSGDYSRYINYGFHPSIQPKKYLFEYKEYSSNIEFIEPQNDELSFINDLLQNEEFKVIRKDNLIDIISTWMTVPLIIKENGNKVGFMIYDGRSNVIEEIYLNDINRLCDVVISFSNIIKKDVYLKITPFNQNIQFAIPLNIKSESCSERTLYKINNKSIKEIYIPRNDLI